jgi:type IV pilus assembly protein PilY1
VGIAEDPTGNNRPNGLASPAAVDVNGDQIADAIYAGDLFGNMWKIDLSGNGPNQWDFAYKQGNQPLPIYTACAGNSCNANNVQPITSRPIIVRHPTNVGYLVLFGTGKYFEVGDNNSFNQVTQSYYGIWDRADNNLVSFNRSNLLSQQIIAEGTVSGNEYRVTTENPISWSSYSGWYLDFLAPGTANNRGERQVSQAIARNGKIIFTTLIPSTDACDTGGDSWIMELSITSGGRLDYSVFDVNNDGLFNSQDFYNLGDIDGDGEDDFVPVSGRKSNVGITSTPSPMGDGTGEKEYKLISGADGNIEVITENPGPGFEGRQSWRQLEFLFRP